MRQAAAKASARSSPSKTAPCNDGNACTTGDRCFKGTCKGTGELNCSDGNPCTIDICDPTLGCTTHDPVPNDPPVSCNDGNFCTGPDVCVDGECKGSAIACDDYNPCTEDVCDPAVGCVHPAKSVGAACDDGSACTTGETCQDHDNDPNTPPVCKAEGGLVCNGGNPCIDPNCDANNNACPAQPVYLDGQPCQTSLCIVGQVCLEGQCQGGEPENCDDGNPCTIDTCDERTGCLNLPIPKGTKVACDDANPCTVDDQCDGDVCRGTELTCAPLDSCHKPGTCNPEDGMCSDPRQPDGTPCDETGTCKQGVCIGGTKPEDDKPGEGGASGNGDKPGSGGKDNSSGGSSGKGSGASAGDASEDEESDPNRQGGVYERKPGGFSCSLPNQGGAGRTSGGVLALLSIAAAVFFWRRGPRARGNEARPF